MRSESSISASANYRHTVNFWACQQIIKYTQQCPHILTDDTRTQTYIHTHAASTTRTRIHTYARTHAHAYRRTHTWVNVSSKARASKDATALACSQKQVCKATSDRKTFHIHTYLYIQKDEHTNTWSSQGKNIQRRNVYTHTSGYTQYTHVHNKMSRRCEESHKRKKNYEIYLCIYAFAHTTHTCEWGLIENNAHASKECACTRTDVHAGTWRICAQTYTTFL